MMERLKHQLEKQGVSVSFSAVPSSLSRYDLVHIFNLVAPFYTETFAMNAIVQKKPFIVTSLQENTTLFFNKSNTAANFLIEYIKNNKPKEYISELENILNSQPASPLTTSPFAIHAADELHACGQTEAYFLRKLFPRCRVTIIHFGVSTNNLETGKELFQNRYGVRDFVLCVGRLETRKNQLMLLISLENEDIPIVFVDGGFTYQPSYSEICKSFRRKGKTIFTGRLSDEMLISAYQAAKVHCLPSWFELPGLVSLEAALHGCNVVASSWGAIKDYLGKNCWYCEPDSADSIRKAIYSALESPKNNHAKQAVQPFTWEKFTEKTLARYYYILANHTSMEIPIKLDSDVYVKYFQSFVLFMQTISSMLKLNLRSQAIKFYTDFKDIFPESPDKEKLDRLIQKISNPPYF